eukprot:CAMPEP_0179868784 /NCGR_PEP_ID=MMETSP0982-20121206/19084_1 /TAXON_ID=483367 /ORGANISM="non described non described, Strain CCMP 2436" /LENGTH=250 /DNA_ID=CAMNT_0021758625 /DNA_START=414 /DNA_END=1167 /DNA_ORIENTATION=-
MNPIFNVHGCTLIVLAEWKPVVSAATYDNAAGISLITAANRRNPPACVDSKIHHNNLINNILPKIQANHAGAADAILLDLEGFVAETNACNLFLVKQGHLLTPHADHCLPGITRETVMKLAECLGIAVVERRISLAEFYAADEVFTTGTMGELSPTPPLPSTQLLVKQGHLLTPHADHCLPGITRETVMKLADASASQSSRDASASQVINIDGRSIGEGVPGLLTRQLQLEFAKLPDEEDEDHAVLPTFE